MHIWPGSPNAFTIRSQGKTYLLQLQIIQTHKKRNSSPPLLSVWPKIQPNALTVQHRLTHFKHSQVSTLIPMIMMWYLGCHFHCGVMERTHVPRRSWYFSATGGHDFKITTTFHCSRTRIVFNQCSKKYWIFIHFWVSFTDTPRTRRWVNLLLQFWSGQHLLRLQLITYNYKHTRALHLTPYANNPHPSLGQTASITWQVHANPIHLHSMLVFEGLLWSTEKLPS